MQNKEIFRQVRQIEIRTKRIVDENLAGKYHSVFKGQGMEFSEVRAYLPGDDIRSIDWNVTARMGTPYVKKFIEERELTVLIMVDMSGSTEFGSRAKSKRALAAELTALFALAAIRNQDKVGCLIFSDQVELFVPPNKGKNHVLRLIREVLAFEPQNVKTNVSEALRYCAKVMKRKAVVFLISDFLDDNYSEALRQVQNRHDLVAIPVFDPREFDPPSKGLMALEDGETGEEYIIDFSSRRLREAFVKKAKDWRAQTELILKKSQVDYIPVFTGKSYEKELIVFFKMRELKR
ncbi:MAG: DUF58 domain-containing protein [Acidobacteria bacterium]|nr:MAG: DUF58 domain-containing protein [Acidobacteriota bacterium]